MMSKILLFLCLGIVSLAQGLTNLIVINDTKYTFPSLRINTCQEWWNDSKLAINFKKGGFLKEALTYDRDFNEEAKEMTCLKLTGTGPQKTKIFTNTIEVPTTISDNGETDVYVITISYCNRPDLFNMEIHCNIYGSIEDAEDYEWTNKPEKQEKQEKSDKTVDKSDTSKATQN